MSLTPNCPGECHCQAMLVSKVRSLHQFPSIQLHQIQSVFRGRLVFWGSFFIFDHKKLFFETNLCSIQREPWCFIMKPIWKKHSICWASGFQCFLLVFPLSRFLSLPCSALCLAQRPEQWVTPLNNVVSSNFQIHSLRIPPRQLHCGFQGEKLHLAHLWLHCQV